MKNTVIEQGIHTLIRFPLGLKRTLFNCDVGPHLWLLSDMDPSMMVWQSKSEWAARAEPF